MSVASGFTPKVCLNCGGNMEGDGHTRVYACEYVDVDGHPGPYEPDAGPVYCKFVFDCNCVSAGCGCSRLPLQDRV